MKVTEFDFSLPESLIASRPALPRDSCRLLILHRDGSVEHTTFSCLPEFLREGDLLLLNNTKVFPARLTGIKKTGGKIELLLVRELESRVWEVLAREKYTGSVFISEELSGELFQGKSLRISFHPPGQVNNGSETSAFMNAIWRTGSMPLPPYIKRKPEEMDKEWYQTVYAEHVGSIAAPTAGLHLTGGLMERLEKKGVLIRFLTLHVGTGTFKPLRSKTVEEHSMEAEYFEISKSLLDTIGKVKDSGRRVIAVGTTVTRAIEGFVSGHWRPVGKEEGSSKNGHIQGLSDIFIYPGYSFKVVDSLITNFHLPRSTPLMLTSALCGMKNLMNAYQSALSLGYRFFSYGDAMLVL
ncbi:MAG TPA: tRNA preQ1(34) S-adenosylmethionine ribosyltransferase-isomerase QueA [Thermodesulfovibrionales bacterium]|nr:tRNA preQ1(34) S-adenosylmethionine ribosyltransferase-isomerase QueA [Thermodesulfovibrionales bacterium]